MKKTDRKQAGFSLLELMISMTITLVLLALVTTLFSGSISIRERESAKTDALTAAQAALNVMSREIANAGYGLTDNGIVGADSNSSQIHFRSNWNNGDLSTGTSGEDITYYFDPATQSIVRYDAHAGTTTSSVVNGISSVTFQYFDYSGSSSTPTVVATPSANTGRIRITVTVNLPEVQGQPSGETVSYTSDVTVRNAEYMRSQY
ncbi:MAG: type II secretion system protein [Acidobacteriota bacterium]|nr:MAG: type II secretion system protein [Acidobacteriota bacterium]